MLYLSPVNGAVLFDQPTTSAEANNKPFGEPAVAGSSAAAPPASTPRLGAIEEDEVDLQLYRMPGTIQRSRDEKLCRHNSNGCCVHCSPLEPWDENYLKEHNIKHMSFHSYMRKITSGKFVSLDELSFKIKPGCKEHPPWPRGICSKCQPGAVTLTRQPYRHVDNVLVEHPALVERFLAYWRATGHQRIGFLLGSYEIHPDVPLGIRARVAAIYEPPQSSTRDGVELQQDARQQLVLQLAARLQLRPVGWLFTDLLPDPTQPQAVRHLRYLYIRAAAGRAAAAGAAAGGAPAAAARGLAVHRPAARPHAAPGRATPQVSVYTSCSRTRGSSWCCSWRRACSCGPWAGCSPTCCPTPRSPRPCDTSGICIYELQQDARQQLVLQLAARLQLRPVGWLFTDLLPDPTQPQAVRHLRGVDTHFLSAQECIMAGHYQNLHPNACRHASSGYFGSKFVTVCVTGDSSQQVHLEGYQVSGQCAAMVRDNVLLPTRDAPDLGYVRPSSDAQYVPDVYYKEKDAYGNEVGASARRVPVAYLLVDVPCGVATGASTTRTRFDPRAAFPPAHRPLALHLQTLRALHEHVCAAGDFLQVGIPPRLQPYTSSLRRGHRRQHHAHALRPARRLPARAPPPGATSADAAGAARARVRRGGLPAGDVGLSRAAVPGVERGAAFISGGSGALTEGRGGARPAGGARVALPARPCHAVPAGGRCG
ncbi:unnamed protein product [Chilo suppressalis]|uniref:MPN domain-containing protein n=1 Tax=Chilo suppressalis TaxID=168631 RepID=A0ABN8L4G9_CHISP|nr:unnamed protein product [Chilo suppressalis]